MDIPHLYDLHGQILPSHMLALKQYQTDIKQNSKHKISSRRPILLLPSDSILILDILFVEILFFFCNGNRKNRSLMIEICDVEIGSPGTPPKLRQRMFYLRQSIPNPARSIGANDWLKLADQRMPNGTFLVIGNVLLTGSSVDRCNYETYRVENIYKIRT
jgi:hypothetical protein